uniref:Uncharacterized protein n=1 Tax=Ditylenchus dipsaci TaxID=166011 RepID=A0A915ELT0_9BILA
MDFYGISGDFCSISDGLVDIDDIIVELFGISGGHLQHSAAQVDLYGILAAPAYFRLTSIKSQGNFFRISGGLRWTFTASLVDFCSISDDLSGLRNSSGLFTSFQVDFYIDSDGDRRIIVCPRPSEVDFFGDSCGLSVFAASQVEALASQVEFWGISVGPYGRVWWTWAIYGISGETHLTLWDSTANSV